MTATGMVNSCAKAPAMAPRESSAGVDGGRAVFLYFVYAVRTMEYQ